MAVRFFCARCTYRLQLESPQLEDPSCPSCHVALLPLPEVTGVKVPPLPPAALRTTPRPPPLVAPRLRFPTLSSRDLSMVRYGAIGIAVAVAMLLVTCAFAWTAFGKPRHRGAVVVMVDPSDSMRVATDLPPTDTTAKPLIDENPPYVPPVEEKPAPSTIPTAMKIELPPQPEKPQTQPVEAPPVKPEVNPVRVFKRRDKSSEEELRKQLLGMTEVALDNVPLTSVRLQGLAQKMSKTSTPFEGPAFLLAQRPDLQGLPLRKGVDCQVGKEPAEKLQVLSRKMRLVLESAIPKNGIDVEPNPKALRAALLNDDNDEWRNPAAVPCLLQMLQAENSAVRLLMVEVLGRIKDKRATEALAMRAMMDLNAEVRELAARQLLDRPREDYQPLLFVGLRYPWAPVAVHAAETLAFVKDVDALPQLVTLLDQPEPSLPFSVRLGTKDTTLIREVVRINHLSNCLLCHPPSFASTDLVRGAVPTPGQPLSPPATQYNGTPASIFVRADTTYLKQDFSVIQPVPQHGEWPEHQRFDYLVRLRRPTFSELATFAQKKRELKVSESREAVLFALRELSGQDHGTKATEWKLALQPKVPADLSPVEKRVGTDWKQFAIAAFVPVDGAASLDAERLKMAVLEAAQEEWLLEQRP